MKTYAIRKTQRKGDGDMKDILMMILSDCPHCHNADRMIAQLTAEADTPVIVSVVFFPAITVILLLSNANESGSKVVSAPPMAGPVTALPVTVPAAVSDVSSAAKLASPASTPKTSAEHSEMLNMRLLIPLNI